MIIVSQDKKSTVNYENIEVLGIGNPLENNNGKFAIIANAITDNQYILAEYKTEERAKEVLQEIITTYQNFKMYESCTDISGQAGILRALKESNKDLFVYEMPKE